MDLDRLAVSETFYSIQGEGMSMGVPSVFLRLAGCNLMCGGKGTEKDGLLHDGATWRCDTIEVWMKGTSKLHKDVLSAELCERLQHGAHLVVTGGEPLLQIESLHGYFRYLMDQQIQPFIEVETNATILPPDIFDQYNVSPKLSNSGMDKSERYFPEVIDALLHRHSQFKFVLRSRRDWKEIAEDFSMIPREQIWLMPGGESRSELAEVRELVVNLAKNEGVNYSDRLQIVVWDRKTGV